MRFTLYGIAVLAALFLWLLVKLDRGYRLRRAVVVRTTDEAPILQAYLEIEGTGYRLLFWQGWDTISAAHLCLDPPQESKGVTLRWDLHELQHSGICERLRPLRYRPALRWILPTGGEIVEPPIWVKDTVWSLSDTLPAWECEVTGKIGKHRYPLRLPKEWGVYPETLWVEARIERFTRLTTEIIPQAEGTEGYTLLLNPSRVQVHFWVPISMAERWKPSDFEVVVDMRKVLPGDSVVYPEIRRRPPFAQRIEIVPSALGFTRVY